MPRTKKSKVVVPPPSPVKEEMVELKEPEVYTPPSPTVSPQKEKKDSKRGRKYITDRDKLKSGRYVKCPHCECTFYYDKSTPRPSSAEKMDHKKKQKEKASPSE
jgi:hypothetical protein